MQALKKELTKWERACRRYNKESLKVFKSIKTMLEKKNPDQKQIEMFGKNLVYLLIPNHLFRKIPERNRRKIVTINPKIGHLNGGL